MDCGILSAVLFFAPYRLPKFFLNTRRLKSKKGERVEEAGQGSFGEAAFHGTHEFFELAWRNCFHRCRSPGSCLNATSVLWEFRFPHSMEMHFSFYIK